MRRRQQITLVLGLAALGACDAQVDPSYGGEPMVRIAGALVGFGENDRAGSGAILWNRNYGVYVPAGPIVVEPLHLHFPARVTMDVVAPPPDEAYFAFPGESARIAEGYLFLRYDGAGSIAASRDFIGAARDVALVYVEGTVEPGSMTAAYLGGALAPGYHLCNWHATAGNPPAQQILADRCADAMVAAGQLSPADAQTACSAPRQYQLAGSAADVDTPVTFFRHLGIP